MKANSKKTNSKSRLHALLPVGLIIVCAAALFLVALGEVPYWDRDEPRNAGCAAEMLARGDWVVPTFNDQLRSQKPVLQYWLMMLAYNLFGVNEFGGRFFSAIAGVGTCLLTWSIGKSFFDQATGLLAALIVASCLMFCVAARAATPDSILIFFCTASLAVFARSWQRRSTGGERWRSPFHRWRCVIGVYAMLGLAVLTKGPVGYLLPMAMMGWFLLQQRYLFESKKTGRTGNGWIRRLIGPFHPLNFIVVFGSMRPVLGMVIVLAIAAPWFILIGLETDGEFTSRFFLTENLARATGVMESHRGGFWFYPLAILIGFFPWSIFWGPVVCSLWNQRKSDTENLLPAGARFMLIWVAIQVVAFSIAQTKLPSYVTPCYPALALLTAAALVNFARSRNGVATAWKAPEWVWQVATASWLVSGLGFAIGIVVASKFIDEIPSWLAVVGIIPFVSGAICWRSLSVPSQRQPGEKFVAGFAGGASVFCFSLFVVAATVIGQQNRFPFQDVLAGDRDASVATFSALESSWVYYAAHPILELRTDEREDKTAFQKRDQRPWWGLKERLSPRQFLAIEGRSKYVITPRSQLDNLKQRLPGDVKVVQTKNWFLKDEPLVLLKVRNSLTDPTFTDSKVADGNSDALRR